MRTLSITPHTTHTKARSGNPGAWGKIRSAAAEITPENIERIAQRVAQLLRHEHADHVPDPAPAGLVDASRLAKHLGLTRAWIYEHAHELGAIRVGSGPRARLRFDLATATAALAARSANDPRSGQAPGATTGPQLRRRRRRVQPAVPLLPVHGPGIRGLFARSTDAVNCLSYRHRPRTTQAHQRNNWR